MNEHFVLYDLESREGTVFFASEYSMMVSEFLTKYLGENHEPGKANLQVMHFIPDEPIRLITADVMSSMCEMYIDHHCLDLDDTIPEWLAETDVWSDYRDQLITDRRFGTINEQANSDYREACR